MRGRAGIDACLKGLSAAPQDGFEFFDIGPRDERILFADGSAASSNSFR
jgi:hypothetical protein